MSSIEQIPTIETPKEKGQETPSGSEIYGLIDKLHAIVADKGVGEISAEERHEAHDLNVKIDSIIKNLQNFRDINHTELADKLIETGSASSLIRYREKFTDMKLSKAEIAERIFESGNSFNLMALANNINLFSRSMDNNQLALGMIAAGNLGVEFLATAIRNDQFEHSLSNEVALKLVEAGKAEVVALNFVKFANKDKVLAEKLFEEGVGQVVLYNPTHFGFQFDDKILKELAEKYNAWPEKK